MGVELSLAVMTGENRLAKLQRWAGSKSLLLVLLFVVALWPRLIALGRYITPDELIWVYRSVQFREAVVSGHWGDTFVSEHPGVVTTWAGAAGISIQLWLRPSDRIIYDWITHVAWFTPENTALLNQLAYFLSAGRIMTAVANSLGLIIIFWLGDRLFNRTTAVLLSFLMALDPFIAGLSGLLHVDGLMTTMATISLMALLLAISAPIWSQERRRIALLILAGATAALAVLAKVPAILLFPVAALALLVPLLSGTDRPLKNRWRTSFLNGLVWLITFSIAALITLPALWSSPLEIISQVTSNANRHIETVLRPTFFFGEATNDPGFGFYPVAILFRLSPVVFIGLILLPFGKKVSPNIKRPSQPFLFLGIWIVIFFLALSLAVKKFDRYALGIMPVLAILAAYSWTGITRHKRLYSRVMVPVLIIVQALYLIAFLPYPLAAYNPLLGGPQLAAKILPIGWGEATSAAGIWLSDQPDAAPKTAVSGLVPSLAPFFPGKTLFADDETIAQADYVIRTAFSRQMGSQSQPDEISDFTLMQTIRYGGLDQAWIYANPNPQKSDLQLSPVLEEIIFDDRVRLLATQPVLVGEKLHYYLRWQVTEAGRSGRYSLKIELRDQDRNLWGGQEFSLVNAFTFYPEYWSPGEKPEVRYTIPLSPGLPPADYELELTMFDTITGAQLPIRTGAGEFKGLVFQQPGIHIESRTEFASSNIPIPTDHRWLDGSLVLRGHSQLPEIISGGDTAVVDLFWLAKSDLPDGLMIAFHLGEDFSTTIPLSRFDSGNWEAGEQIHEKYRLSFPPEMAEGTFPLQVNLVDRNGTALSDPAVTLGNLAIQLTDRLFTLPSDIPIPLAYQFGGQVGLLGLDWPAQKFEPGDKVTLTLYWQIMTPPTGLVNAFVHLVGPDGSNVGQADRWPGGLPSTTWAAGQVIIDVYEIELPPEAPAGSYLVGVGLYSPLDGIRLQAIDAVGTAVPDDRVILPIRLMVGEGS